MKDFNEIAGIWVRNHHGKVQVLMENTHGEWKQVFLEAIAEDCPTSHIVEPAGVRASPFIDEQFNPRG